MENLRTCILGPWIHSHEEDAQGVMVYRPADFSFPPSRGREGFVFKESGELIILGIGQADGSERHSGSWFLEGVDRIRIEDDRDQMQPSYWQVLDCSDQLLQVRKLDRC